MSGHKFSLIQETFEEPIDEKLKFSSRWTLWEFVDVENYEKQMKQVAWFNDAVSFAKAYTVVPHFKVDKFFYDSEKQTVPT